MDILAELNALKADYSAAQTLLEEAKGAQAAYEAKLTEKDNALTAANEAVAAHTAGVETAKATIANKDAAIAALQAELDGLKATQKTAEEKAVEIVANQGVKPIKVDASAEAHAKSAEEVKAEYMAIKDPVERSKFYSANRAAFYGK